MIEHLNNLAIRHSTEGAEPGEVQDKMGLWVPCEAIMVFRVELPKVSKRKLQEMLPWLLEDRLLASPESFEFIVGPELDSDQSIVYVIEKSALSQWVLLAQSASASPERFAPDFLALPYEDGRWTLYTEQGRLLVRTGLYEGFASDPGFGWQQLELAVAQADESVRISHLSHGEIEVPETLRELIDSEQGQINWSFSELPTGIDLLPSSYKPKATQALNAWFPALSLAALTVLLFMSYMLVQSWAWQRDILVLEEAVIETYGSLFSGGLDQESNLSLRQQAEQRIGLLEHQYINLQSSPMAEMRALDSVLSACSDCTLMSISQSDSGFDLRLKDSPQIRNRFGGIDGWSFGWGAAGDEGFNSVSMTSASRAGASQ